MVRHFYRLARSHLIPREQMLCFDWFLRFPVLRNYALIGLANKSRGQVLIAGWWVWTKGRGQFLVKHVQGSGLSELGKADRAPCCTVT